jgi:virginiamycin A acetyltransferase
MARPFIARDLAALARAQVHFFPKIRLGASVANAAMLFEATSQHPLAGFMPLGAHSYSQSVFLADRIGRYCSIAENVRVMGQSHPTDWVTSSPLAYKARRRRRFGIATPPLAAFDESAQPVTIGHDVWIGQDVLLRGGIVIGTGAVIAAVAVVTRDVAPYTIVGGNPARVIRDRLAPDVSAALLALEWWRYDFNGFAGLDFADPASFIAGFANVAVVKQPDDRRDIFAHLGN